MGVDAKDGRWCFAFGQWMLLLLHVERIFLVMTVMI